MLCNKPQYLRRRAMNLMFKVRTQRGGGLKVSKLSISVFIDVTATQKEGEEGQPKGGGIVFIDVTQLDLAETMNTMFPVIYL